MFDKIQVSKTETVVTPVTRVVEQSITPDKVTEMYDKIEKEVEATILRRIVINDNSIEGSMIVRRDERTASYILATRFTLNGTEYQHEENVTDRAVVISNEKLYEKFMEFVFNSVAINLTKTFQPSFIREFIK